MMPTAEHYLPAAEHPIRDRRIGVTANYLQQTAIDSNTNGYDVVSTAPLLQAVLVRALEWKRLNSQSRTDSFLNTVNNSCRQTPT